MIKCIRPTWWRLAVAAVFLAPSMATAQTLTGTLTCTVEDATGGVRPGTTGSLTSPALLGGPQTLVANPLGQLRFVALPPGTYALDITLPGFAPAHVADIRIGAGAAIARTVRLTATGAESVVVEPRGSRIDVQDAGFAIHAGIDDLQGTPGRHASMFDPLRAMPGISPTSPSSGTVTTISAAGSGTNESQFRLDGTNHTCTCNGTARIEPAPGFIQEVQVQLVGPSAEFGYVQGAVVNVITRQGTDRLLFDGSYYGQTRGLTSRPVLLLSSAPPAGATGYTRVVYRDLTTMSGGPFIPKRAWFFLGYQYLRDADSQPGADPSHPRAYSEDKIFLKLNWRLAPGWQLEQSVHYERGVNPDRPTYVTPYQAVSVPHVSAPAMTFGHLTHVTSGSTVWEARAGRFTYERDEEPSTGDWTARNRLDRLTGVSSGAPPILTRLSISRTTGEMTVSHDRSGFLGADHLWKAGAQIEDGEHRSPATIPGGERFVDNGGAPFQRISSAPSNTGGRFISTGLFATDVIRVGRRLTIDAGVRFDRSQAIGQDLRAVDDHLRETGPIVPGRGTFYTWNVVSPRFGFVLKLTADGRTMLRGSQGRYTQGVLTGEIGSFSAGATSITTAAFEQSTQDYTRTAAFFDPAKNLLLDPAIRPPHTDESSLGVDREVGRRLAVSVVYMRKNGRDFIGWTDSTGIYKVVSQPPLPDGRVVDAQVLTTPASERVFKMTNPPGYSLTYNGLIVAVEKRLSRGWRALGSYTWSRAEGLMPSSGAIAAGPQVSTVAPPPPPQGITFGRDLNDLTNARGLLPNDRTHIARAMTSITVPKTGLVVVANLQYFSGKPWAATTQVNLAGSGQGDVRVLIEPRGTQRLPSQTLLDLRVSRTIPLRGVGRVELLFDLLNALNDHAEEGVATDTFISPNFGKGTIFMDPRRVMLGVRMNLGR